MSAASGNSSSLNAEERTFYGELADVLIPSAEGMPSASEAGVPLRWLDEALRIRPDLGSGLAAAIQAVKHLPPTEAIEQLNMQYRDAFEALGTLTAGAYFLNPDVRKLIGYPGQEPQPTVDDTDTYLDLLSNVAERGPIYRDPEDENGGCQE